jgi:hypothetical protein
MPVAKCHAEKGGLPIDIALSLYEFEPKKTLMERMETGRKQK